MKTNEKLQTIEVKQEIPTFTWDFDKINEVEDLDKMDLELNAWLIMTDGMERHVIYKGDGQASDLRWRESYKRDAAEFKKLREENDIKVSKNVYVGDKNIGLHKVLEDGTLSKEIYDKIEEDGKARYVKRDN